MIDTHAHVYASEFDHDRDEVIARARQVGIEKILMPNIDLNSIAPMLATEKAYPDLCHSMMGLHPCYVDANVKQTLATIYEWFLATLLLPWAKSVSTYIGIRLLKPNKKWRF